MSEPSKSMHIDLPATTKDERVLEVIAAVTSIAPWFGGPISNVLTGMSIGRKMDRVHRVLEGLASDVKDVKTESTNYVRTEEFEDILENTLKRVAEERDEQKLATYRAFMRTAIKQPGASYEDLNQVLRSLSELRTIHVRVLKAIAMAPEPRSINSIGQLQTLRIRVSQTNEAQLLEALEDLNRLGLVKPSSWKMTMTPHGAANLRHLLTPLAERLLYSIGD